MKHYIYIYIFFYHNTALINTYFYFLYKYCNYYIYLVIIQKLLIYIVSQRTMISYII